MKMAGRNKPWLNYLAFLIIFSYVFVTSVLLFMNGFLLTKESIPTINNSNRSNNEEQQQQQQQQRVVLLLVDALRYDFTLFNDDVNVNEENDVFYLNKMPVFHETLIGKQENARLFKFVADPPTTTMQRLKALTTGSLPTFIDASSNFHSKAITEDSLIHQMVDVFKKNVTFMGDDTWMNLFPNKFTKSFPFPSFNVKDLDTVDNGVTKHLKEELGNKDWQLLIGHYLGVDHCGHRYGPNHPEMARKLTEMNEIIKHVIENIPKDAMLFVIGDHGMTNTGDHGGESIDEVTSAMFVYSPTLPLTEITTVDNNNEEEDKERTMMETRTTTRREEGEVKQVDLVPTLAQILGTNIPYSNLGITIIEALPQQKGNKGKGKSTKTILKENLNQMYSYIKEYSSNKPIKDFDENNFNVENTKEEETELIKMMLELRKLCEEVWIEFDSFSITRGLLLLITSLFFTFLLIDKISQENLPLIFNQSFALLTMTLILSTCLIAYLIDNFNFNNLNNVYFYSNLITLFILIIPVVRNFEDIATNSYQASNHSTTGNKKNIFKLILTRIILLTSCLVVFSNSYILEEAHVLLFLTISLLLFGICIDLFPHQFKARSKKSKEFLLIISLFCLLIRLSLNYFKCREEQGWCKKTNPSLIFNLNLMNGVIGFSKMEWAFAMFALGLFVTLTRMWLKHCGNLSSFSSLNVLFSRYVPTVLTVCVGGFWVINSNLNSSSNSSLNQVLLSNNLAKTVFIGCFTGVVLLLFNPICAFLIQNQKHSSSNLPIIPRLFRQVKGGLNDGVEEESEEDKAVPVVCGLATVYSSSFLILLSYLGIFLVLLSGDYKEAPAVVIMMVCAFITTVISGLTRFYNRVNSASASSSSSATSSSSNSTNFIDEMFAVPFSSILLWTLLSCYFFYATGHQPSFPNINWNAAFIGINEPSSSNESGSKGISATFIILNTFSSQIFFGLSLPLLQIVPFTLFVMMPNWFNISSKKSELLMITKDTLTKGEMILYEKQSLLISQYYKLCVKYILCHGIRMFASMLASTIHCRHLMVWSIFAPKFIFDGLSFFITILCVFFSYLLLVWINHKLNGFIKQVSNVQKQA